MATVSPLPPVPPHRTSPILLTPAHRPATTPLRIGGAPALLVLLAVAALAGPAPGGAVAAPDVTETRRQVARFEADTRRLEAEAGAAAAAHNRALDRRDSARTEVLRTRRELAETRGMLAQARRVLADRLVQVYTSPQIDPLEVLLRSGSLSDVVTASEFLELAARRDAGVVARVRDRQTRIHAAQMRLRAAARRADAQYRVAVAERTRVTRLLALQRDRLARSRSELRAALAARRAELQRQAASKRRRLVAASRERVAPTAPAPAVPAGTGNIYPLAGPSTFADDWLAPRGGRFHEGIDLFAERGTPVVAVADGTLFRVGSSGISGNRLWLRDAAGTEYFYAHLDGYAPAARDGAHVRAGTVLGFNGDTGDARGTPPHVHFEIHPGGGGPVRPFPIVSGWRRIGE